MLSWTDERVERLKSLWGEGLSASQIASELGGVTRNAVIGKVHRLGLSGRVKPQPQAVRARRVPRPAAPMRPTILPAVASSAAGSFAGNTALKIEALIEVAPQPVVIAEPETVGADRATILTLTEQMCKWPIGDPGRSDFHFCGRRSEVGIPYCGHHARLAYQPARERKRA
jgi:GcrA cell cycle regulator